MTASVNILRGDLHLAVSKAFNRGRYVLMTGGGDGRPIEITIDLRERPDDLFEAEGRGFSMDEIVGMFSTDDHGASIPTQGEHYRSAEIVGEENGWAVREPGPRVYEFALQDINFDRAQNGKPPLGLHEIDDIIVKADPAADWVHVYDRVTRERRTLKRPEPDRILTGLRDVAADLRRQAFEGSDPTKPYDGSGMVKGMADLSPLIVTRDGVPCEDQGAALEEFKAGCTRGAPVEPPFGCKPRD